VIFLVLPIASTIVIAEDFDAPKIEMENISGGINSVSTDIKNTGDTFAENVYWTISVKDVIPHRFRQISVFDSDIIECIPPGEVFSINAKIPKGFGLIKIDLKAEDPTASGFIIKSYGFVFGDIVIIFP